MPHCSGLKLFNLASHKDLYLVFFTLYTNHLANCSTYEAKLFADDTCFVLQNKNINQLNIFINQQIETVNNWIIAKNLTLDINKSNIILIKSNKTIKKFYLINLILFLRSYLP